MNGFYVENFGCRAAQADGAAIERQFRERGMPRAASANEAAIVVLNTCTVTSSADQDARSAVRRLHRENPGCQIVVTGCYAQRAPEEIAAIPGVSQVIGNSHKHRVAGIALANSPRPELISLLPWQGSSEKLFVSDIFAHTELLAAPVFDAAQERTRPNLKVQDGCNNRCSFCVIPYVRGHSRSLPLTQVLREVDVLVNAGYREVVISGINLGRWGRDLSSDRRFHFEDLIRSVLERTSLQKLRISSVEPMDWADGLIALMAQSPRIAKHAHVPMQSGSDRILRFMHRKYRPWHYREKIEKIRDAAPDAAIGADVMAGFPGETDADFEETRSMVETLPLTYLHVFTYSPRPGTPAANMQNQVSAATARERNKILRELSDAKKSAFMRSFMGKRLEAITLNTMRGDPNPESTEALTDNFLKLRLAGKYEANQWMQAEVQGVESGALLGTIGDCAFKRHSTQ